VYQREWDSWDRGWETNEEMLARVRRSHPPIVLHSTDFDALRQQITEIVTTLGSNIIGCEVNVCHGCKEEVSSALAVAKAALLTLDELSKGS
jgi:hypothetical protein